jgi:hypothetical protein
MRKRIVTDKIPNPKKKEKEKIRKRNIFNKKEFRKKIEKCHCLDLRDLT